jgi:hypothetical protein
MVSDPLLSAVSSLNAAYDRLVRGCVDEGITALVTDLDRLNRASSRDVSFIRSAILSTRTPMPHDLSTSREDLPATLCFSISFTD